MHRSVQRALAFILLVVGLWGCGGSEPQAPNAMYRIQELEQEIDSLRANYKAKDDQLNEITQAVAAIEENMMAIRGRERTIRMLEKSRVPNKAIYVKQVLQEINEYLLRNRKIITGLETKMAAAAPEGSSPNPQMQRVISSLRTTVSQIEVESNDLKTQIKSLNARIADLNSQLSQKNQDLDRRGEELQNKQSELDERTRQLYTAYFTTGSYKELLEKGVLVKTGGVLGVGKSLRLADKLDKKDFKAVNTRSSTELSLGAGTKAQLITVHPSDSYRVEQEANGNFVLVVTDIQRFWSMSRYLVTMVD